MEFKTKKEKEEEEKEFELNLTNNKDINETVNLTFEFYDTEEKHYHGVKTLITKNFVKICNPGDLSDIICKQEELGTIIGIESDNEVSCYAIQTFLNLKHYENHECIKEIKKFLNLHINDDYKFYIEDKNTSWFINERVINCPFQLIPILYEQLIEDKNWVLTQKDENKDDKEKYNIQFLIYISNCIRPNPLDKDNWQYYRLEDESLNKMLIYFKEIPVENQLYQQIMIFKYDNLLELIKKIKSNFK